MEPMWLILFPMPENNPFETSNFADPRFSFWRSEGVTRSFPKCSCRKFIAKRERNDFVFSLQSAMVLRDKIARLIFFAKLMINKIFVTKRFFCYLFFLFQSLNIFCLSLFLFYCFNLWLIFFAAEIFCLNLSFLIFV